MPDADGTGATSGAVPTAQRPQPVPAGETAGSGGQPSRGRLVVWAAVAVVVAAVALGAVLGSRLGSDPTLVDSPLIGTKAAAAVLPPLEGGGSPVRLRDLRGQVVVVNFWASWCVECRREHPDLMAAADAYSGAGVVFLGVDFQDQRSAAIAFLDELGRGRNIRYVTDPGSRAAVDFGVFGVPETFVIDRSGTIVSKITGRSSLPLLSGVLDAVLAGRTPSSVRNGPVQRSPGG